jgi:hypothetical protein
MCLILVPNAVGHFGVKPHAASHTLHHFFTKQPSTKGYPHSDIRARKGAQGRYGPQVILTESRRLKSTKQPGVRGSDTTANVQSR